MQKMNLQPSEESYTACLKPILSHHFSLHLSLALKLQVLQVLISTSVKCHVYHAL